MPDTAAVLARDARLGDPLRPPDQPGTAARQPRRILLTGVTGFLGGQLAAELLRTTGARLWCVVRARADAPRGTGSPPSATGSGWTPRAWNWCRATIPAAASAVR